MEVILGRNAFVEIDIGHGYLPWVCCETCEISIETDHVEVKTVGDGIWSTSRMQGMSYNISMSGLEALDQSNPTGFDLIRNQIQGVQVLYRMVFQREDETLWEGLQGKALVKSSSMSAPIDFVTGSFTLLGCGPLLFASLDLCDATIGNATVIAEGGQFRVTITPGAGVSVRFDYRIYLIDSGLPTWDTAFANTWLVNPSLAGQTYHLQIIPFCENGIPGATYTTTFES